MSHVTVIVFNQSIKDVKIPENKPFRLEWLGKVWIKVKIIIDNFKSSGPMECPHDGARNWSVKQACCQWLRPMKKQNWVLGRKSRLVTSLGTYHSPPSCEGRWIWTAVYHRRSAVKSIGRWPRERHRVPYMLSSSAQGQGWSWSAAQRASTWDHSYTYSRISASGPKICHPSPGERSCRRRRQRGLSALRQSDRIAPWPGPCAARGLAGRAPVGAATRSWSFRGRSRPEWPRVLM